MSLTRASKSYCPPNMSGRDWSLIEVGRVGRLQDGAGDWWRSPEANQIIVCRGGRWWSHFRPRDCCDSSHPLCVIYDNSRWWWAHEKRIRSGQVSATLVGICVITLLHPSLLVVMRLVNYCLLTLECLETHLALWTTLYRFHSAVEFETPPKMVQYVVVDNYKKFYSSCGTAQHIFFGCCLWKMWCP